MPGPTLEKQALSSPRKRGPIFQRPVVMGPHRMSAIADMRTIESRSRVNPRSDARGRHSFLIDQSNSNGIAIKMLFEELDRQRQRAIRLRLGIGLAAVAREGVVGAGIFVDGHQRIG